ncbi:MAG: hypothetical protein ACK5MG_10595 [Bacteroidales bacterium]
MDKMTDHDCGSVYREVSYEGKPADTKKQIATMESNYNYDAKIDVQWESVVSSGRRDLCL